jgi:hypothetical protein
MFKRLAPFAIMILLCAAAPHALGQQNESPQSATEPAKRPAPAHYYKLDFVVRESDQGKVLSQRSYSLGVAAAGLTESRDWWSLRAGTKVPAGSNYVDVGFNVDVRAEDLGGALQLRLKADLSSLAPDAGNVNLPPIRQMRVEEAVLVPINKPSIVFNAEDPSSKHQFQIEVTAVPQK